MDYGCEKYLAEPVPSAFLMLEKEHSPGDQSLQGVICGAETMFLTDINLLPLAWPFQPTKLKDR